MNRKELSAAVAKRVNLTQADAGKAVDGTFDIIKETIATGEKVEIIGFGSFEAKLRDARTGRNPKTGETIEIPAAVVPSRNSTSASCSKKSRYFFDRGYNSSLIFVP